MMETQIFAWNLGAPLEEVLRENVSGAVYRLVESSTPSDGFEIPVARFQGGVRLDTNVVRETLVARLATHLARSASKVEVYRLEVLEGADTYDVSAEKTVSEDDGCVTVDLDAEARQLAESYHDAAGGDVARERMAESIRESLTPELELEESRTLGFEARVSSRLIPLIKALEDGANWKWMELHGERALKISTDDGSQISVLSEAEIEELDPWLGDG